MPTPKIPTQKFLVPSLPRKFKWLIIPDHTVSNFYGMNTVISDIQKVADGFSPDELNWLAGDESDCIVLRRGTNLLGKTRNSGAGQITGLGVGKRVDGTEVPFFSYPVPTVGQKIKYYDLTSDDTYEVGSNALPLSAVNDAISLEPYQNLAGGALYVSSPNSDIYKIMVANPTYIQAQGSNAYKGSIKFGQSRLNLWNNHGVNGSKDLTGLYMSWIDRTIAANYMTTVATYTAAGAPGLNDLTSQAPPNNLESGTTYNVIIDGVPGSGAPDTFKWNTSNSATYTTGVPITAGLVQYLADGVSIMFAAATGHTIADSWAVVSSAAFVSAEAVGMSGSTSYAAYQLLKVPSTFTRTAFGVNVKATVAAGTETFSDDGNGNLSSNFGGTGTINYTTGILSVTFSDVTTGNVTASYYWEDATQRGVIDFSLEYDTSSSPPSRIAGSGRYFAQFDGGGSLNAVLPFSNIFYGLHTKKTWQTSVPTNDDDGGAVPATNLPFRELMGATSRLGADGGPDGLYFINNANPARPTFTEIIPRSGSTAANQATPNILSNFLDLSPFAFDYAVVKVWDIYALFSCQQIRNGQTDGFNSRSFIYNTKTGAIDLTDYPISCAQEYMGSLISGDPLSDNIFTLFSGFDDDGALIPNYWTSGYTNHGTPGQKSTQRMVVNGLIQTEQRIRVSVAYDGGNFVDLFTIEGDGSYVNRGASISVGQYTVGSKINGGGGEVFANPFEVEFGVNSDRYEYIRVKFEALNGGYAQINFYTFKINKYKGEQVPSTRMVG